MKQLPASISIFFISILSLPVFCQYQGPKAEDEPLRTELSMGLNLNTNSGVLGGAVLRYGYLYPSNKRMYASLEIVNIKHPIEWQYRSITGSFYIPNKTNYILAIRPQMGTEIELFDKEAENGVALSAIFAGGPTVALVKPYYLKVRDTDSTNSYTIVRGNDDVDPNKVLGHAGFFTGFGNSYFEWGINAKAALNFEFGKYNSLLTGLEAGWNIELFTKDLPIHAFSTLQTQVFSSLYLTFYFGGRY